jgi:hypothetical protein
VQAEKHLCTPRLRQAFPRRKIPIIASGQYNLYSGEIDGFDGDHMSDLEHYIFLGHIVDTDPTGVVSPMPGIYNYSEWAGLPQAQRPQHARYAKPQTDRAHRLTDHHPAFIILPEVREFESSEPVHPYFEVRRECTRFAGLLKSTAST